ncbi:MAG: chaperone modulator CbpM [Burkholderiales bacterium]
MQNEADASIWLDPSNVISITDLVSLSGLSENEITDLVEAGVLIPLRSAERSLSFSADCVITVRKATRLLNQMELDIHAVALTLSLLQQIERLEAELSKLRAERSVFPHR